MLKLALTTLFLAFLVSLSSGGVPSYGSVQYYPGLVSSFRNRYYDYRPAVGYIGCQHWCLSKHYKNYYCCSNVGLDGYYNALGGNRLVGGGSGYGNRRRYSRRRVYGGGNVYGRRNSYGGNSYGRNVYRGY